MPISHKYIAERMSIIPAIKKDAKAGARFYFVGVLPTIVVHEGGKKERAELRCGYEIGSKGRKMLKFLMYVALSRNFMNGYLSEQSREVELLMREVVQKVELNKELPAKDGTKIKIADIYECPPLKINA